MLIIIETILVGALSILNMLNIINYIDLPEKALMISTFVVLALGIIPLLITLIKRGLGALTIYHTYSSTNIILIILNMLLYIPVHVLSVNWMIYVIMILNALKLALDIIKKVTGRELFD